MLGLAFVPVFGMFLFLSLQHKCDGAVGFIFHKNLGRFLSQPKWSRKGPMWQRKLLPKTSRWPALEGFYRGRAESLV